jgi:hypothetical protein
MHCHRFNHEDNGLMALINVIPAVSTYAVAVPGAAGKAAEVRVYDGNGDRLVATVTPFPGFEGSLSVAMGDVDNDGVLDLVVGAGKDHAPEVVAYTGKAKNGKGAFQTEVVRFQAFAPAARGGLSVAAAQIDGSTADNIIVGSGPGMPSEVTVYRSALPSSPGAPPPVFSTFSPYGQDRTGVSLATGFVDFSTGRNSIVTAPGAGRAAEVRVFAFPLLISIGRLSPGQSGGTPAGGIAPPTRTASFVPFGNDYRRGGGVSRGWLAGTLGGAKRIVVSELAEAGTVKVWRALKPRWGISRKHFRATRACELTTDRITWTSTRAGSASSQERDLWCYHYGLHVVMVSVHAFTFASSSWRASTAACSCST